MYSLLLFYYYSAVQTNNCSNTPVCTWGAPKKSPLSRIYEISPSCSGVASYFTGNFLTYYCVIAVCIRGAEGERFLPGRNCTRVCVRLIGLTYGPGDGKGERRWHLCTDFFDALVSPEITRANTYRLFPASSDKPFLSENTGPAIIHGQLSAVYKD